MSARFIRSFPPIAAPNARVLILGSMPGIASLEAGQYYAHPRNAFWRIMGELVGAGPDKPYEERVQVLRARGIALWDVLQCCIRPGSLDTEIRNEKPNDFAKFFADHPGLSHIGFNGGKAAASFKKHAAKACPSHIVVTRLPSTSPAHAARSFEEKCAMWRTALPIEGYERSVMTMQQNRAGRYAEVEKEIAAILDGETNLVARMATVASVLHQTFDHYFWTGFYIVDPEKPDELVIGPYQGTLGCLRIPFGKGVCGTAAAQRQTVTVPDVHAFPGHIACDPRSRSEIVAPVFDRNGALIAVFDVDSDRPDMFDKADREGLERIMGLVAI